VDPDVVGAVADGAADDAGGVDPALLGTFLPIVVEAASSGRRLRPAELTACGERGSVAAQAGVPLRALIDLYLSACWRLWERLDVVLDGDAAQVRAAGLAVLRAADDAVAALAEGFQLARNDLSRHQESARRELFDTLLAGGPDAAAVTGRAADLGIDLTSPHAVLVARHERTFDDPATASVPRQLERALAGRHGDANPLVAVKNGLLVCVFAAPDPASVALVGQRLGAVLAQALPGGTAGRTWQSAVGRTLAGATSVRVSYEQAHGALDLAQRLRLSAPVVDASELVIYQVLLRDRAAVNELVSTVLGPLATARGGAGPLLETLDAYYASGGVSTATAERLHLSVRAVTYRLQRVRELLGTNPTDPAQRFTFQAAVLAARLLRWPDVPLTGD
jgi:sugar diacid utilization regulator